MIGRQSSRATPLPERHILRADDILGRVRPIVHAQLINRTLGDPGVIVDLQFERRAILFDIGDITVLPTRKLLRVSDVFVSHTHKLRYRFTSRRATSGGRRNCVASSPTPGYNH